MANPLASLFLTLAAGAIGSTVGVLHARRARRLEAEAAARWPRDAEGVIAGAGAFSLERPGAPAVLLLHGAGDTPASLRYLADALHHAGYAVSAPLLPGHGRSIRDFATVTADAWYDAAREAVVRLARDHSWVAVGGLSMGGALAVRLAADPQLSGCIRALVLLAPYVTPPAHVRLAAGCSRGWGALVPYVSTADPRSIHDATERGRALGYGVMTPAGLRALVGTAARAYAALPDVTVPTLVVFSRNDNRVAVAAATRAFERLGTVEKRVLWRDVGGHILPVDHGKEEIFAAVIAWLADQVGASRPSAGDRAAAP